MKMFYGQMSKDGQFAILEKNELVLNKKNIEQFRELLKPSNVKLRSINEIIKIKENNNMELKHWSQKTVDNKLEKLNIQLKEVIDKQQKCDFGSNEYQELLNREIELLNKKKQLLEEKLKQDAKENALKSLKEKLILHSHLSEQQIDLFFERLKHNMVRQGIYSLADLYYQYENIDKDKRMEFLESIIGKFHLPTLTLLIQIIRGIYPLNNHQELISNLKEINIYNWD
ncbi:Uncharacterised protein [[Flavobacterium] thermophilum]|nr:Uncharacterised protein [[Flavobacterium] thermophilum]